MHAAEVPEADDVVITTSSNIKEVESTAVGEMDLILNFR
jgi:hypothetical protein